MSEPSNAQLAQKLHNAADVHEARGNLETAAFYRLAAQRLESSPATSAQGEISEARPLEEWHEDIGSVLWWKFPINEPPYVGSPLDTGRAVEVTIRDSVRDYTYTEHIGGWPGYHTHFTLIPLPAAAKAVQE